MNNKDNNIEEKKEENEIKACNEKITKIKKQKFIYEKKVLQNTRILCTTLNNSENIRLEKV